jgi:pimeloyl-ACP methyl ester carboxylesterase
VITETDLTLADGRTLHCYDSGEAGGLTVFWHHGSPNTGTPPEPLFPAAAGRGIRWISYDRPGYMSSTARPGRDKASAAADAAAVADALGVGEFAVLGHSGGGSHALACGALLPGRVLAVAEGSGLAPFGADGLDWFAGMTATGAAEIRAAVEGREALEGYLASHEFDMEQFTPADQAALLGEWAWTSTAGRTGWCRTRLAPGWPPAARTRSYGCARTTGTSRSSAPAGWQRWTGWWPMPEARPPLSSAEPVSSPRCAAGVAG